LSWLLYWANCDLWQNEKFRQYLNRRGRVLDGSLSQHLLPGDHDQVLDDRVVLGLVERLSEEQGPELAEDDLLAEADLRAGRDLEEDNGARKKFGMEAVEKRVQVFDGVRPLHRPLFGQGKCPARKLELVDARVCKE